MINKKWKWVAVDEGGYIYVFTNRPPMSKDRPVWMCAIGDCVRCDDFFSYEGDWKGSLHEIIHHEDGKIEFRKALPELKVDDPVFVRDFQDEDWTPRHFFRWTTDGRVMTFPHGTSSFTIKESDLFEPTTWEQYKLP